MTEWLLVVLAIVLTLGTAVFVAAEFSLVALDRPAVQRAVEQGDHRAGTVLASLRQLSTQLSAAQVGITLTTLVLGFIAAPSIGALLSGPLRGSGLSEGVTGTLSSTLALVIATVFSMIVGELVPQFLGISAPLRVAKIVARPVRIFEVLARPLILLLNGSANAMLRAMRIEPQEELSAARTPQELASLVSTSAAAGTLDEGTARLVTASLGFGSQTAADVMSPRSRASSVDRTASAADVVALARATGHSRFPVLGADWDDIDGVVHIKAAIAVPYERRAAVPVSALMVDPVIVPETLRLDPLLAELRSGHQFAVVIDEYGGTSGVVTLEDVVEEIVGDVGDEHDRGQTTGRRLVDGSWTIPGLWRPDEVRTRTGAEIPDGPAYETVGGFAMASLGRVPQVGDEIDVVPGWRLVVADMDGRRVDRLRLIPAPVLTDEGAPEWAP